MNTRGFVQKLSGDCLDPSRAGSGWQYFSTRSPFRYTSVFEGVGIAVHGSFDPATSSGSVAGTQPALRFDNYNRGARAIAVGSFGLKASGSGAAVVTGRIERTRTLFSRFGPPKPLLRLTHLKLGTGPFQSKGKDVPDTFVMGLTGRATVLPAFARELTRIRCRGPHIVTSRPIRAGTSFGVVKVQLRPDAATGIGGTFELAKLSGTASTEQDDVPITVMPSTVHVDLPADLRTPLSCQASYLCTPRAGTQLALGAGFTMSLGDHSVAVAGLTATYMDRNGKLVPVVTGTLDGTPVTVIDTYGPSEDFASRLATAFGAYSVRTDVGEVAAHFTNTAPPD